MKKCHDWDCIDYIRATCPYCGHNGTYFKPDYTGDGEGSTVFCNHGPCREQFKLGERE